MTDFLKLAKNGFKLYGLGQRVPLFVLWLLTNRCNIRCVYCNIPYREYKELDTKRSLEVLDEMAEAGTVRVGMYGGEPLVRKDIYALVKRAKENGLITHLYTNGALVERNLDTIKQLDGVFISLDGPEEIHDKYRGKGTFQEAMRAIEVCSKYVPVFIMTVLTNENKSSIQYISDLSSRYGALVNYQPVLQVPSLSTDVTDYKLSHEDLKECIEKILELKNKNPRIALSKTYLKRMLNREPNLQKKGHQLGIVKCWNGTASCQIDADGSVHSCLHINDTEKALNLEENNFKEAFEYLGHCSCTTCNVTCSVEYNFWLSFNPESIINLVKLMAQSKNYQKVAS
ncbi:MAG: radical SAM protein [Nitrospina sp.]|jgi:MoaA/NifB/PqqE/SkfB family radical SAM enzyme|nr:radical SAM protein [Nitrospina sp.]MBT5633275.1 radical SAM protein [Nitrospina sp.]